MPVMTHTLNFIKYDMPPDKGNHVKLDSRTWHGMTVDTWKVDAMTPYLQMVGYFVTQLGKEVVLERKDLDLIDIESLEFHNKRRDFFCDLIKWSFHGFADRLHYQITVQDLIESRQVIEPFPAANGATHETIFLEEHCVLGGKVVFIKITSEKLTNGPFNTTIDFFRKNTSGGVSRHFIIEHKGDQPFIKMSNEYERHKDLIAETLGLKGKP
ncbi:hypothetical protein ACSA002_1110 [Salmonella phage vB_SalM_SA002]|nr:hypothetical protein ACSA002_1110 [Salmonella phage vB_SalM_SA002]